MTIQVLLRKHKLKCSHGPSVTVKPFERHVKDESSTHVTDADLRKQERVTFACGKCKHVVGFAKGLSKNLLERGDEIPLLLNLEGNTDAGAVVTVDGPGGMDAARHDLARFLKDVEGGWHDPSKSDPNPTNKGITRSTWDSLKPAHPAGTFEEMKDADWNAIYNSIWSDVASRANTSSKGVTTSASFQDPTVLSALVDWQFNGNFLNQKAPVQGLQQMLSTGFGQDLGVGDGKWGPQTINAFNAVKPEDQGRLIDGIFDRRQRYNESLGNYQANKKGWADRLQKLKHLLKGVRGVPQ